MQIDKKYMKRALFLARAGGAEVAPNPMVGCVIVHNQSIIGEGYHRKYGEAHAEVNAITSVADESLLSDATLYVTLEPCSHHGKTPPCAQLIIDKRIPRVVVACLDPYSEVSGRGVEMLQSAGVEVVVGVMQEEAEALNRFFITAHTKHRPYIILKWAQSEDGFIDRLRFSPDEPPVIFSSEESHRIAHKRRTEVSAIMVGTNTAFLDNPSLTVRHWSGHQPVRICIDEHLHLPLDANLFDGQFKTLVFTSVQTTSSLPNVEYIPIDYTQKVLPQMMHHLYERGLYSLIVEGGAKLHNDFLKDGLYDELIIEKTPTLLNEGVQAADIAAYRKNFKLTNAICFYSKPTHKLLSEVIQYTNKDL